MYETTLYIHSWLRWIILLVSVVVIARSAYGWATPSNYSRSDARISTALLGLFDLQMLLGLILYIVLSPYTSTAFGSMGNAMRDPVLRFWSVEHILVMIIALTLAHIGSSRTKKAGKDILKFRTQFIFYLISLILILFSIPWEESPRMFRGISE